MTRVAYIDTDVRKKFWFAVIDGVEQRSWDGIISNPIFSPNSKNIAYVAEEGDNSAVVLNGVRGKLYNGIGDETPIFSPDGKQMCYAAKLGNKEFIVIDGKEEKHYDALGKTVVFSANSKRLAYMALQGIEKWFVVVDQKEGTRYDEIVTGSIKFSPDSKRIIYIAISDNKCFIVDDGKLYASVGDGTSQQYVEIVGIDATRVQNYKIEYNKFFIHPLPEIESSLGLPAMPTTFPGIIRKWNLMTELSNYPPENQVHYIVQYIKNSVGKDKKLVFNRFIYKEVYAD